jgi:hypothetical protein
MNSIYWHLYLNDCREKYSPLDHNNFSTTFLKYMVIFPTINNKVGITPNLIHDQCNNVIYGIR